MTIARTYYGDKAELLAQADEVTGAGKINYVTPQNVSHLVGIIDRLSSALKVEPEGLALGKWYDISTAPRDGTEFLGWDGTDFEICIDFFGKDGWIRRGDLDYCCFEPTHWTPLPLPPREAKDD